MTGSPLFFVATENFSSPGDRIFDIVMLVAVSILLVTWAANIYRHRGDLDFQTTRVQVRVKRMRFSIFILLGFELLFVYRLSLT
jgi:hypothetical protein